MLSRIHFVKNIAALMVLAVLLVLGYILVDRVEAADTMPPADGNLYGVYSADQTAGTPGDGMPLYPGDEKWEAVIQNPDQGLYQLQSGTVEAVAINGTNVYAGGNFGLAGNTSANNIARWDGSTWHALGAGVEGSIYAITIDGNDVYVSGSFSAAGGQPVQNIARWDGSAWHDVGGGVNGTIYAMVVNGSNLYVGGIFTQAGNQAVSNLARWDGSVWHDVGGGVVGSVSALAISGSDLYIGGSFSLAGSQTVSNLARWDGSVWHDVGGGVKNEGEFSSYVSALAVSGNDLYIGGEFTQAGSQAVRNLARWDGSEWHDVGGGVGDGNGYYSYISALAVSDAGLYVIGYFNQAGSQTVSNLALWDGSAWNNAGGGVNGSAYTLAVSGSNLYVGVGYYATVGSTPVSGIARWDGAAWYSLGQGVFYAQPGEVKALAENGSDLYVGGTFNQIGGQPASNIARWDGSAWHSLGSGVDNTVNALAMYGTDLFAGGNFSQAGGQMINGIARWDGSAWHNLGGEVNGEVDAIAVNGADVYVGGRFSQIGGQDALNIARWDGSHWHALGSGVGWSTEYGDIGEVDTILINGNDVYAGGGFPFSTPGGGELTPGVVKWDGSSWQSLGWGVDGSVYALAMQGGNLYAAGSFTGNGTELHNIGRWDGSQWHPLGEELSNPESVYGGITSLAVSGTDLYVGGAFQTVPTSDPAPYNVAAKIIRWDGSKWWNLGSGLTGFDSEGPSAMVATEDQRVVVAGNFNDAGNTYSPCLAIWHIAPLVTNSFSSGAPGSTFTLTGRYFPANTPVTILVNGNSLTQSAQSLQASSPTTDAYGVVKVNLATSSQAVPGTYQVTLQAGGTNAGSATLHLAAGQPVQTGDGTSPTISVPAKLLPTEYHLVYLPALNR